MKRLCNIIFLLLIIQTTSATRIKDIAYVQGLRGQQLIGYGLVVGLSGSGDTQSSTFTYQSVMSMLKRFGITVSQDNLRLRNVAAVMVTATVPPFIKEGGTLDVIVSSLGDAKSLSGGTLLLTPLSALDGNVYATAQGPVSVGGFDIRTGTGAQVGRNFTAAGRVPNGGIVERAVPASFATDSSVTIVLRQMDFTTANRVAVAVNTYLKTNNATAIDGATIVVLPPRDDLGKKTVEFISTIEMLQVDVDVVARVVINERTGTVVVGGNVSIAPVAITHGSLNIEIQATPVISQPPPFSQGKTVSTVAMTASVAQDTARVVAIEGAATVQDVAKALNSLKITPRDIIAVFQALKESGALAAELIIL